MISIFDMYTSMFIFFPQENDYVIVQSTIPNPSPSRTFFMSLRRITESLRSCKGVWNGYWPTER